MRILVHFLLATLANAFALLVANDLWSGVHAHGAAAYLVFGLALGVVNAFLKPLLTLLSLPLIVLTLGLFYLLINVGMVALAVHIAPNLSADGFWNYVGIVFICWLVNWAVNGVLGRGRPAAH
jgi:putative membrane protein